MKENTTKDMLDAEKLRFFENLMNARDALKAAEAAVVAKKAQLDAIRGELPPEIVEELEDSASQIDEYSDDIQRAIAELKHAELQYSKLRGGVKSAAEKALHVLRCGPTPQRYFEFEDGAPDWHGLPVEQLAVSQGLAERLKDAKIKTLGRLSAAMDTDASWFRPIAGIGPKAAGEIEDAFRLFWAQHPELHSEDRSGNG